MISGSNEQQMQQLEYSLLKPDCHSWWISKMQSDTLEERYAIKFCLKAVWSIPYVSVAFFRHRNVWNASDCFSSILHLFEHLAWIEHQFLWGIKDSRKAGSLWGMMRGVGGVRKSIHQSWLAKELGLGLLCWGFKGVQQEIPREEASPFQNGSVAFPPGQCTSPQLHPCHRLFDSPFHTLPIIQTLLHVTFGYSLSSEAIVMRELRRWKRLWRRSLRGSHKRTSMGPSRCCWNGTTSALQPEEITSTGTRVSCVYYQ